jgi:hypothetical protein
MKDSSFAQIAMLGVFSTAICVFVACADSLPDVNRLIGKWSRNGGDCGHPEFIFEPQLAEIDSDADGTPVRFKYPDVTYETSEDSVTVDFHKNHPIGGTASGSVLSFRFLDSNHAEIVRKRKAISIERCREV